MKVNAFVELHTIKTYFKKATLTKEAQASLAEIFFNFASSGAFSVTLSEGQENLTLMLENRRPDGLVTKQNLLLLKQLGGTFYGSPMASYLNKLPEFKKK